MSHLVTAKFEIITGAIFPEESIELHDLQVTKNIRGEVRRKNRPEMLSFSHLR